MPDSSTPSPIRPTPAGANSAGAPGALSLMQLARAPVARQLVLLAGIAMAVALGVAIVLWSRGPNMGLLYAGLAPKDASGIVQALQAANTPYKLGSNGTSIFVPAADIDATRLRLAAQGLPEGTASSQVAPAPDSAFGISDAAQANRNRQLLEQDLERTIASLQSIRSARVHLALPKPSAFIRDNQQPSASILVSLYPGRTLASSQVAAIVHLVAASVPNLDPSRVSVVDQQGQLLTRADGSAADAASNERMQLAARIENVYAQRVEDILTPITGAGNVRAQVHVDLDLKHTRQASEVFGKDKEALRSEQVSSQTRSAKAASGAVPGALSNQPPVTVPQATAAQPNVASNNGGATTTTTANTKSTDTPTQSSHHATRNYAVDHTISYTTDPAGDISRLTVAVIVDDQQETGKDGKVKNVPYTKAELAHMTELTRSAVGFDAKRGDVVSVVNEAFHRAPAPSATPSTPFWQRPGIMDMLKQGLGVLAALALAFGLLRPMLRGLLRSNKAEGGQPHPLPGPQPVPAMAGAAGEPARVDYAREAPEPQRSASADYEEKVGLARRTATESPQQVAQIVKSWVATDGG